ncbi:MAG: hypothetical protein KGL48_03170 [Sphingomonadales bacterium]|nr:hypothetical protein [Sphingomonadales bacterium]MDE2570233.1 hypothetical protein [Sphingomonadales bacterium]
MRARFVKAGKAGMARTAMALALSTGLVAGGAMLGAAPALAKEEKPAPLKLSPGFTKAAGPMQKALQEAAGSADVKAAGEDPAKLGAALAKEKTMLDQAFAAASTPDDTFVAGQFAVNLGSIAKDPAIQLRGLKAMISSGKPQGQDLAKYNYFAGSLAYQAKDYASAETYLQAAVDQHFAGADVGGLLAETYFADNKPQQGLESLKAAIAAKQAAGTPAPENWYKRGMSVAYQNKLAPQAIEWSQMLVKADPSPINWLNAGQVTREFAKPEFTSQESLDLGRLLLRSGGLNNQPKFVEREYVEYVQAADPRRNPGEVVKVINAGVAAGALNASDTFVSDALSQAKGRIAGDKASLAGLESDARKAANGMTAMAAGDAFLSYDQPAKAEEMYQLALSKGGVETERVETRLGIAQADQGKYADAQTSFARVTGARKALADLWTIYAQQKAAPAPAPAAPAAN